MQQVRNRFAAAGSRDGGANPWPREWPEIVDARVRGAFKRVDRTRFIPETLREWADRDAPLPIGEGQTVSQPFVIALMAQALALGPGDRVLEIGTGSGYQTAILSEITAEAGHARGDSVFSVERFPSLANAAMAALRSAGYAPHVRVGDGAAGWPEAAPFAGVVVSAAAPWVPRAYFDQLRLDGRLAIPVGSQHDDQMLLLIEKRVDGPRCTNLGPVRFVPLVSPLLDDEQNRLRLRGRAT